MKLYFRNAVKTRRNAFTLVELLVVITIIGLLATMVTVSMSKARAKGRVEQAKNDVNRMVVAYENFKAENLVLPDNVKSCSVDTGSTADTCNASVTTWETVWSTTLKSKTLVPADRSKITYSFITDPTGARYAVCAFGGDLETTYIVGKDADINVKAGESDCAL